MDRQQQLFKSAQIWPKAFTANGSMSNNDTWTVATNAGATGTVTVKLPKAEAGAGPFLFFVATSGKTLSASPATGDAIRGKAVNTAISNSTLASLLMLTCVIAGTWEVMINNGTWA